MIVVLMYRAQEGCLEGAASERASEQLVPVSVCASDGSAKEARRRMQHRAHTGRIAALMARAADRVWRVGGKSWTASGWWPGDGCVELHHGSQLAPTIIGIGRPGSAACAHVVQALGWSAASCSAGGVRWAACANAGIGRVAYIKPRHERRIGGRRCRSITSVGISRVQDGKAVLRQPFGMCPYNAPCGTAVETKTSSRRPPHLSATTRPHTRPIKALAAMPSPRATQPLPRACSYAINCLTASAHCCCCCVRSCWCRCCC
jgi:hypothetical protein